jgi:CheY-like chemotaxis protein
MSRKTILYVEDNEPNRMMVRDLLKRTTYNLIEAYDGEAGVAMAVECSEAVSQLERGGGQRRMGAGAG